MRSIGALGFAGEVGDPLTQLAIEQGFGSLHYTTLILASFAVGTAASGASLGIGAKVYTWPAGYTVMVLGAALCGALSNAASVKTDTPEVGLGTVVASGAIATLSGTQENIVDGGAAGATLDADAVAPDCNGTAFQKAGLSTVRPIVQKSGGAARDLFLNAADAWAASANGAVTFTGEIHLVWVNLGAL